MKKQDNITTINVHNSSVTKSKDTEMPGEEFKSSFKNNQRPQREIK
jgi:hypothetical protein